MIVNRMTGLSPRVRGSLNCNEAVSMHGRDGVYPRECGAALAPVRIVVYPRECGARNLTHVAEVYPRECGAAAWPSLMPAKSAGLSPRVRGSLSPRVRGSPASAGQPQIVSSNRSIPASAGQPADQLGGAHSRQVYPRECGAAETEYQDVPEKRGLSPRVRGSRLTTRALTNLPKGLSPRVRGSLFH